MPYSRTFYHLVWSTRERAELIRVDLEDPIQRVIRSVAKEHKALVHAVGFMPDHVHVVASIPPSIAVSTLIGKMKGSSSHLVNNLEPRLDHEKFYWQSEFGVVTFGEKFLNQVVEYALNQAEHHASNKIWQGLERVVDDH